MSKNYRLGVAGALLVILSFLGGLALGETRAAKANVGEPVSFMGRVLGQGRTPSVDLAADVDFEQFWDIWKKVKSSTVFQDEVSDKKMFYGAIAGMVGSLKDPYSVYFDPEYAQKFAAELSGTFEGIGAEIGIKQDQLTVIAPLPGTPAEKAGIRAGDRILAIDETDTLGMSTDDAVSRIRGKKGTVVHLLIGRSGEKEAKDIAITRGTIIVQAVTWKMQKGKDGKPVGVITISHFNEQVDQKFNEAVRGVLADGAQSIILDLRNNPGGYLDTAVTVAGEWVHQDTVVVEKFSDGKENVHRSYGLARLAGLPTIVLVNGGSASASEIVSGALKDANEAVLVGEKTFGKGSVQDYSTLPDGSALKLTVALWYTPNGTNINKEGIQPDVTVPFTTEDFNADRDPQMDKALELLATKGGLPPAEELRAADEANRTAEEAKTSAKNAN